MKFHMVGTLVKLNTQNHGTVIDISGKATEGHQPAS